MHAFGFSFVDTQGYAYTNLETDKATICYTCSVHPHMYAGALTCAGIYESATYV